MLPNDISYNHLTKLIINAIFTYRDFYIKSLNSHDKRKRGGNLKTEH